MMTHNQLNEKMAAIMGTPGVDYANDLNAMRKAEETLSPVDKIEYGEHLNEITRAFDNDYYEGLIGMNGVFGQGFFDISHADAWQRALAFVQTKK